MTIKVNCEFDINKENMFVHINEHDLDGKSEKEAIEYIFDCIIMPFLNDHMILSYDVISNSVI